MFIDPRFKLKFVDDKEKFYKKVEHWITEESEKSDIIAYSEPVQKKPRKSSTSINSIFELHTSLIANSEESPLSQHTAIAHELLKYKSEGCCSLSSDPIDYWKVRLFISIYS